ncbi:unnamed protein product [Staurois parvus]|uniref:Ig-like domain-containing protein n=1 Tax=Staurois parvus TaxID=386267 RepID=A0ABN9DF27_9NEOB|nr:unnamed protein product [Staurois parvus]
MLALYFSGWNSAQSVDQTAAPQTVLQGHPVFLECTYKVSVSPYVMWYVQYPGKAPAMLLHFSIQTKHKGFSAIHDKAKTSFHMNKDRAELSDSGVYFCAVTDTVH